VTDAPDKSEPKVKLAWPVRILLAALVLAAALVFLLAGVAILSADRTQMPSPRGALVMALLLIALGLGFGFIAVRLVIIREATAHLFTTKAALVAGPLISVLGLTTAITATFHKQTDAIFAGIALIAIGYRLYRSGQQRKTASAGSLTDHPVVGHPRPSTNPAGARIDTANTGAPGAVPSSRSPALAWTVAVIVAAAAAVLAVKAWRTAPDSQWMSSAQYQREFDTWAPKRYYPHEVDGECQSDGEKFRADWKTIPAGAAFFAHHGMTRQDYERRDREYRSRGYALESLKYFRDCSGIDRYQATWLKR